MLKSLLIALGPAFVLDSGDQNARIPVTSIEEALSPEVLDTTAKWILANSGK